MACTCHDAVVIVAPTGREKCVDGLLGGQGSGKVLAGSGLGNTGAAEGDGAAGSLAAGAAGTCVWAETWINGRDNAISAAAQAKRTDMTDQAVSPYFAGIFLFRCNLLKF